MKLGNRKKKREQYLLDVRVQTQGRLRRRVRWIAAVLSVAAMLALVGYSLYWVVRFAAERLVFENPHFAIAQIVVEDDGVLTPQQVTWLAGVRVRQNLLSVDLEQVRRNLEMMPLAKRVEVRRLLPRRLFIRVDERVAVARLHVASRESGDTTVLVDRSGVVMKPIKLAGGTVLQPQAPGSLPLLTGITLADVQVGKPVESEQLYRALELMDRLEQVAAGSMLEVEQIDLSKPRQLSLITKQHTIVKFDVEEFPQQLRRLGAVLSWAQQRQKLVRSVDLTVNRGVPVAFAN